MSRSGAWTKLYSVNELEHGVKDSHCSSVLANLVLDGRFKDGIDCGGRDCLFQ